MKSHRPILLVAFSLILGMVMMPFPARAIDVTVQFNSSTVLDTLSESHFVQIRGELNVGQTELPDGNSITWDSDSDLIMTNIGGDYWEITFEMNSDDTLVYKFWTGWDENNGTSVVWDGWEGPLTNQLGLPGDNRAFITGQEDTVLDVQYYNSTTSPVDQYWRPYEEVPGSVAFYFRVNMAGYEENGNFDPDVDGPVTAHGGTPLAQNDTWDLPFVTLTREAETGVGASFYAGVVHVPEADLVSGDMQEYKFVFYDENTNQVWEDNISNRWFDISNMIAAAEYDTTIHWPYFDNRGPTGEELIETTVTWLMDPGALEQLGFFDRNVGDQLLISGPNGWGIPDQAIEVIYQPLLEYWIGQEDFTRLPGDVLQYKYLVLYDSSRVDTLSPNYFPGLPGVELWEEPSATGGANRLYTILNQDEQTVPGDFTYDYQFYSGIPPEGVIDVDSDVTFNINMEPATDPGINETNPLFRPGVDSAYLFFESPVLMLSQGLPAYEHTVDLEDLDGDGIYSATMEFVQPFVYQLGYRVGYTTDTDDVINGGGVEAGRRYYQFIWPQFHTPGGETIWFTEFNLPTLDWAPWDLPAEIPPDFSQEQSVYESNAGVPDAWNLAPAYPNPFNPSTTISFMIGAREEVIVRVYSILGQEVQTLVSDVKSPGIYTTTWNGRDSSGQTVASGVYFIQMTSPSHHQVRKVTLIR
jgi:FlgD Ig-like domain